MTQIAVIDTNVVVAGLLTAQDDAPTAQIIDGMLATTFQFAVSTALLAEYRDVLNRARLRKRHGLGRGEVETLVVALAEHAIVLAPVEAMPAPDPGDQHLWDLLAARDDLCLVTGDNLLLQANDFPAQIISPSEFVRLTFRASR